MDFYPHVILQVAASLPDTQLLNHLLCHSTTYKPDYTKILLYNQIISTVVHGSTAHYHIVNSRFNVICDMMLTFYSIVLAYILEGSLYIGAIMFGIWNHMSLLSFETQLIQYTYR